MKQMVLTKSETLTLREEYRLSRKDITVLASWKREKVICYHCLYVGRLYDFKTFNKKGKNKLSRYAECPECGNRAKIATLRRVSSMSMVDFAHRFWEDFYLWRGWMKKTIPRVKKHLKHFTYENRQIFWDVWREWKETKERGELPEWVAHKEEQLEIRRITEKRNLDLWDFLKE